MKKNGFAITALLYGLSIMALMTVVLMMSIMQNTRKNNTTTVKSVEQELNSYGQASADFSGETTNYTVPAGQSGYYKIELFGGGNGGSMVSGTIFLEEHKQIKFTLPSNGIATVEIEGESSAVMKAGKTTGENYINGMAKWANSVPGNHHFINGQEFLGVNDKAASSARINKVSSDKPVAANTRLDKVGCIKSAGSTIGVVTYREGSGSVTGKTGTGEVKIATDSIVSEIYISLSSEKSNPSITLYSTNSCGGTTYTIPGSGYTFLGGTESTISRFSSIEKRISAGNYSISLLSRNKDNKHKTVHNNTLSTSAFTPTTNPRNYTEPNLIIYGTVSIGRPVIVNNYKGLNSQKWRIEPVNPAAPDDYYSKVSEIEEYKPFAMNTGSQDTATGIGGPVLICGVYKWENKFVSHDTEMNSNTENKKWAFEPAGLGLYKLRANQMSNRYLRCEGFKDNGTFDDGKKMRCYLTNDASKADLFQVFNSNL